MRPKKFQTNALKNLDKVPPRDPQRPFTWIKYSKGLCEGCWAGCCTLPVEVSVQDLIRLEWIAEEEAAISLKQVARRLMKEKKIQAFQAKSQLFVLEQVGGRDCILLGKDRLCTVYEKRPAVCRAFPKIGPRPGFCPQSLKTRLESNQTKRDTTRGSYGKSYRKSE